MMIGSNLPSRFCGDDNDVVLLVLYHSEQDETILEKILLATTSSLIVIFLFRDEMHDDEMHRISDLSEMSHDSVMH